jgi:hypothetical protein
MLVGLMLRHLRKHLLKVLLVPRNLLPLLLRTQLALLRTQLALLRTQLALLRTQLAPLN